MFYYKYKGMVVFTEKEMRVNCLEPVGEHCAKKEGDVLFYLSSAK